MFSTASLPNDAALLKAMVSTQQAEIEHLKFVIAKLRRMQFGRRSEQLDATLGQQELLLEELESVRAEQPVADEPTLTPTETEPPKRTSTRKPLPGHLPRVTVEHAPAQCGCPTCGGILKKLGQDISEILEYEPASFKVIRHIRPKFACTACDVIVQADAPSRPIARA